MWIALCALIQLSFQQHLNAMAPTMGYQGYAPTLPHQQCGFGAVQYDSYNDSVETITMQVAALMHQSQLTTSMVANTSLLQEHQIAQLAATQDLSDAGCGVERYHNPGGHGAFGGGWSGDRGCMSTHERRSPSTQMYGYTPGDYSGTVPNPLSAGYNGNVGRPFRDHQPGQFSGTAPHMGIPLGPGPPQGHDQAPFIGARPPGAIIAK